MLHPQRSRPWSCPISSNSRLRSSTGQLFLRAAMAQFGSPIAPGSDRTIESCDRSLTDDDVSPTDASTNGGLSLVERIERVLTKPSYERDTLAANVSRGRESHADISGLRRLGRGLRARPVIAGLLFLNAIVGLGIALRVALKFGDASDRAERAAERKRASGFRRESYDLAFDPPPCRIVRRGKGNSK